MTYAVGSIVEAVDYNSLIDKYNGYFADTGGLGLSKVAVTSIVTRDQWYQLWQKVFDAASAAGRSVTLPFHSSAPGENPFSDAIAPRYGYLISALPSWGPVGDAQAKVKVYFTVASGSVNEPTSAPSSSIGKLFGIPGTYDYVIPNYITLSVDLAGGGGGGGSASLAQTIPARSGDGGGASVFASVVAYGGTGGLGSNANAELGANYGIFPPIVPPGPDGSATGGDQNINGGGGAGGYGSQYGYYEDGVLIKQQSQGEGSKGGRALKTWTAGAASAPVPGTTIQVVVGSGGFGAQHYVVTGAEGYAGGGDADPGYVKVTGMAAGEVPTNTTKITFRIALDQASNKPVSVKYATADITATAGTDYVAKSDTVTFAPGETYKDITIEVLYDVVNEPDETFAVNLSSPSGASLGPVTQAVGTILGASLTGPPPPTTPPAVQHGSYKGYYQPVSDAGAAGGAAFANQFFFWDGTLDEPTPPPGTPLPGGFNNNGLTCVVDYGTSGFYNGFVKCVGLMSNGNPYAGDPVLTCFPGRSC